MSDETQAINVDEKLDIYKDAWKDQDRLIELKKEESEVKKRLSSYNLGVIKSYPNEQPIKVAAVLCANKIKELIALKLRQEATEEIVKFIKTYKRIYTIRDDEKPEIWIYNDGIYIPQGLTHIRELCRLVLGNLHTNHICNDVVAKIMADTYIEASDFFVVKDIYKIPVINGILNLKTQQLEEFSPDMFFFNKLPVVFDKDKDCPFIKKHFQNVLKDDNDITVIQEIFGYLLFRDYTIEKAFMFIGSGRNGKGKTIELMKRFIGPENCTSINLVDMEKNLFALSQLHNKMANLAADLSHEALKNTGNFKQLTGHDLISADRKFQTRVNFVNYAKMIFACNELPMTYDITTAFFNRWILIDFPYTFLDKAEYDKLTDKLNYRVADRDIIEKLSNPEELSGLLNWSLDGLKRLLAKKEFSVSSTTEQVKKQWQRRSSSISAFMMDCLKIDYDGKILKDTLRQEYVKYCKEYKLNIESDKALKYMLEKNLGAVDSRITECGVTTRIWKGIVFCQPCQGCHGFSSSLGTENSYTTSNTMTTLTSSTTTDETDNIPNEYID